MRGSRALGPAAALLLILLAVLLLVHLLQPDASQPSSDQESAVQQSPAHPSGQRAGLRRPSHDPRPQGPKGEAGFVATQGGRRQVESRRRPPTLAVLAVDRSTDEPLAEAVVALHETQSPTSKSTYQEEITALDGTARLELPKPGEYYLSVSCEGYLIGGAPFQYDPAQGDIFKKISLIPAYTLRGRVLNQRGRFLSQAEVSFSHPGEPLVVVESGPGGVFEVVLNAGRYRVTATKHPHLPAEIYPVEVGPGRLQEIDIVIQQQAQRVIFWGRISDRQGHPIHRARISLTDLSRSRRGSAGESVPSSLLGVAATDSEGRFRLETVPRSRVQAKVEAQAFQPVQQSFGLEENLEKEFRLKPYPTFVVRAVSGAGEELPIASGHGTPGLEVVGVDADGQKVIGPVQGLGLAAESSLRPLFFASQYPFEIYAFDRTGQHGITGRVRVGAHRPEITLVADQAAQLHGHVSDQLGNPIRQFVVTYQSGLVEASLLFESDKGEFKFLNLPEGPCTIQILSPQYDDYSTELVLQRRTPAFLEAVVNRRRGAGL